MTPLIDKPKSPYQVQNQFFPIYSKRTRFGTESFKWNRFKSELSIKKVLIKFFVSLKGKKLGQANIGAIGDSAIQHLNTYYNTSMVTCTKCLSDIFAEIELSKKVRVRMQAHHQPAWRESETVYHPLPPPPTVHKYIKFMS